MNLDTSTESRALELLGQNIPAEIVAANLGVTPARISQLLSSPDFAAAVAELRYKSLAKHNARDASYEELEDKLITKMNDVLPLMTRPMEVTRALVAINGTKRRGASTPDSGTQHQTIISLVIPTQVVQKFQLTQNMQVTHAGTQELLTMQSGTLLKEIQNASSATASPALAAITTTGSRAARSVGNL